MAIQVVLLHSILSVRLEQEVAGSGFSYYFVTQAIKPATHE